MNTLPKRILSTVLHCLGDEDIRVRKVAADVLTTMACRYCVSNTNETSSVSSEAVLQCNNELMTTNPQNYDGDIILKDLGSTKSLLKVHRGFRVGKANAHTADG